MAKRPTTRRSSRSPAEEPEDEDDGFAWDDEAPAPKQPKSTSGKTAKRTSAALEGSSKSKAKRTSGTTSARGKTEKADKGSARMAASGRAKRSGSASARKAPSDDGVNTSGRRRRASGGGRKKDNSKVLLISLVTGTFLIIACIVAFNSSRGQVVVEDHQSTLDGALKMIKDGQEAFNRWNQAVKAGQPTKEIHHEALTKLQTGVEQLSTLLDQPQYKGPDGYTKPEFEGYETELSNASQLIVDLEKGSSLH